VNAPRTAVAAATAGEHEVRAATGALPALDVSVRGGGAALALVLAVVLSYADGRAAT
jgi:hypothetical protein